MPVSHDLYQDLKVTKEEIQQKRSQDVKLNSLLDKYAEADKEVVKAENNQSDDDYVRTLKEKRLLVKDEIVRQLEQRA
ncbi:DUF465 domain-containing protein [Pseudomonas sp. SWRI153]|uniref:DUF465 domain-containing protein n=1 Tax=Pseudomonas khorasanensis TaxID=2745508 RepID=A0A923EZE6_9PSED|nr:DUF465 domain-containing protein [Pseudomonas khorasanensis]MBV4484667.1 DUF465 domain-containing protein [Pseudomonas khorasanensis]